MTVQRIFMKMKNYSFRTRLSPLVQFMYSTQVPTTCNGTCEILQDTKLNCTARVHCTSWYTLEQFPFLFSRVEHYRHDIIFDFHATISTRFCFDFFFFFRCCVGRYTYLYVQLFRSVCPPFNVYVCIVLVYFQTPST